MRTVEDLQNNVSAILTGIDLNEVNDLDGCFERAASTLIQQADVPEASGREPFFLYDGVTDYPVPASIFGAALVDLRPQGRNRQPWDTIQKTFIERFDRYKNWNTPSGYIITFEYYQGTPVLRINSNQATQGLTVNGFSSATGFTAAGSASGLAVDSTVYWQQPGSLVFNLAAAGSEGTLTYVPPANQPNISLSSYLATGVAFVPIMLPATGAVTSVKLRIGTNSSNYYEMTATAPFNGPFIANYFQQVAFYLNKATKVGNPVAATSGNYIELLFEYNGTALNGVRVGGLTVSLPSAQEMLFYSGAIFQNGTNAPSTSITAAIDTIILGDPAYNLYVRECARGVALQQGGALGSGIIAQLDLELEGDGRNKIGLYQKFKGSNPSEELRTVGNWYYD